MSSRNVAATTAEATDGQAWPQGVQAITLFVENLERTRGFYQAAYGVRAEC